MICDLLGASEGTKSLRMRYEQEIIEERTNFTHFFFNVNKFLSVRLYVRNKWEDDKIGMVFDLFQELLFIPYLEC